MWDQSQLKLALGSSSQAPSDAKSVASTDVGENGDFGDHGTKDGSRASNKGSSENPSGKPDPVSGDRIDHDKVNALEEKNAQLKAEIESLRHLVKMKDNAVIAAEDKARSAEANLKIVTEEKVVLFAEKQALADALEQKSAEISSVKQKLPGMEKELEDFKAQNSELASGFSKLSEAKSEIEVQSDMFRQSKEASDVALQKMTDRLREMQKDRDSSAVKLEAANEAIKKHAAEMEQLNAELKAVREAKSMGPKEMEDHIADLTNQVCSIEQLLQGAQRENASLEARILEYQQSDRDNMFVGILGGAASTLFVGGLCQLFVWGSRK